MTKKVWYQDSFDEANVNNVPDKLILITSPGSMEYHIWTNDKSVGFEGSSISAYSDDYDLSAKLNEKLMWAADENEMAVQYIFVIHALAKKYGFQYHWDTEDYMPEIENKVETIHSVIQGQIETFSLQNDERVLSLDLSFLTQ